MAKFSKGVRTSYGSPIKTASTPSAVTYEGGTGYERDAKSELFLLAVTNMVGEDTYYESAAARDSRFVNLIRQVAAEDHTWLARFIPWLRDTANMRSAATVAAVEYVKAGAPYGRQVVAKSLIRADEPAEALGYHLSQYGRQLPMALKRGIADAAAKLYTEYNLLKYDGQSRDVRFADVIELCHPCPIAPWQSDLFRHAIDRRHGHDDVIPESLSAIREDAALLRVPEDGRRVILREDQARLRRAGWTWERLSGWLPGGMDAEAWEAVIPQMGYMALLRNLRNFEQAGIRVDRVDEVIARLTNPDNVATSRQFPFRFYSAWRATEGLAYASALERALDHSTNNIPRLAGRTLVLIDISGSMGAMLSRKSTVERYVVGALFGSAVAKRQGHVRIVLFGTDHAELRHPDGLHSQSVLRTVDAVRSMFRDGRLGYGTNAYQALADSYQGEDRVVIFTDEQVYPYGPDQGAIADKVPVLYTFNLAGYKVAGFKGGAGRYTLGGFSDSTFKVMDLIERHQSAGWDALFGD